MAFTVRFIFEGVCAFVPDSSLFIKSRGTWRSGSPSSVTVLLPALQTARSASWKEKGRVVLREPHWAFLTVDQSYLKCPRKSERLPDLAWKGSFRFVVDDLPTLAKGRWASMALQNEKLTLKPDYSPGFTADLTVPAKADKPTDLDRASLWWLPRMAELSPTSRKVEKSLKPGAGALNATLSASLEITQGELSMLGFNLVNPGVKRKWTFTQPWRWWHKWFPPKRYLNRPVGNTLSLVLENQDGPLEIGFKKDTESFVWIEGPEDSTVDVFVSNMELEDRFLEPVADDPEIFNQDPDFEDLYALSRGSGASGPVPDRRASNAGPVRTPCSPGGFDGWKS